MYISKEVEGGKGGSGGWLELVGERSWGGGASHCTSDLDAM